MSRAILEYIFRKLSSIVDCVVFVLPSKPQRSSLLDAELNCSIADLFHIVSAVCGFNFVVHCLTEVHADVSCRYSDNANIYPFAFRTHAHSLCEYSWISHVFFDVTPTFSS